MQMPSMRWVRRRLRVALHRLRAVLHRLMVCSGSALTVAIKTTAISAQTAVPSVHNIFSTLCHREGKAIGTLWHSSV